MKKIARICMARRLFCFFVFVFLRAWSGTAFCYHHSLAFLLLEDPAESSHWRLFERPTAHSTNRERLMTASGRFASFFGTAQSIID